MLFFPGLFLFRASLGFCDPAQCCSGFFEQGKLQCKVSVITEPGWGVVFGFVGNDCEWYEVLIGI